MTEENKKSRTERIVGLRRDGHTYQEIADELGTSKSVVYRHLKSFGDKDLRRQGNNVKKLDDVGAAYIAGILDGEGCLTLSKQSEDNGENITPVVKVNMAAEEVIEKLCDFTGLSKKKEIKTPEDRKRQWVFRLYAQKEIIQLLEQVKEYMIEKEKEAEILLEFCRKRKINNSYTEREYELLEEIKGVK
jgi:AcrR family transcriptional regulator